MIFELTAHGGDIFEIMFWSLPEWIVLKETLIIISIEFSMKKNMQNVHESLTYFFKIWKPRQTRIESEIL